jgi:hypothetical protein
MIEVNSSVCEYARAIVSGLVDDKKAMVLTEIRGNSDTILELSVADSDAGQVLGRGGHTVNSIRALLYAFAKKNKIGSVTFRVLNTKSQEPLKQRLLQDKRFSW